MPSALPELHLQAPWGAAAVLGLLRVVPRVTRWQHLGRTRVFQEPGQNVAFSMRCLVDAARLRRKSLNLDFPAAVFVERGLLGEVTASRCVRLEPGSPYNTYEDHFYMGSERHFCLPWGLVIINPVLTWSPEGATPRPTPSLGRAQAGLFGGRP